jgi:hypothetical protein
MAKTVKVLKETMVKSERSGLLVAVVGVLLGLLRMRRLHERRLFISIRRSYFANCGTNVTASRAGRKKDNGRCSCRVLLVPDRQTAPTRLC